MFNPRPLPNLTARISDGADGYVIATCSEIPGCMSQGSNREEALANLAAAVELCLDTMIEDWFGTVFAKANAEAEGDIVPMEFIPPTVRPRSIA